MKAESVKKVNSIIAMLQNNENVNSELLIAMLTELTRIETPTTNGKFDLFKYVEKDNMRPQMQCVFHDNGFKVASDGHILVVVSEPYPEDMEGKLLHKDGTFETARKYPDYKSIRPLEQRTAFKINIDAVMEAERVRKADKKLYSEIANGSHVIYLSYEDADGRLQRVYYKTEWFAKFATFMKAYGIDEVMLNTNRPNCALYATNGESWGVIMPVVAPDTNELPHCKQMNA